MRSIKWCHFQWPWTNHNPVLTWHRICGHTRTFVHRALTTATQSAGAPKATTNKLQRVLNAAAHVVSGTHKFNRGLSQLLYHKLHWLDIPERVVYKLGIMVFNCRHGQAPQYLVELCQPVAGVASQQHLRSAAQRLLVVPRHQLSSYGRRVFCVAGQSVWNSLPDSLRNPIIGWNSFRQSLKTFLFATYWCIQHIRGFTTMRYINRLFTYLLTYFKVTPLFDAKYLTNSYRYSHSYYRRQIGNRTEAFKWHQFQWSWVTSKSDFKVTIIFNVK